MNAVLHRAREPRRRLRVLHIGNGKAFKIRAILEGLRERGHDVHMVPIPPDAGSLEGTTWHRLPDAVLPGPMKVLEWMYRLRRLTRRLNPDIVHAHNAWGPGWYGAASGRHPFVIHAYGGDLLPEQVAGRPAFQHALTSWACRSADRIIVTGRHMIAASRHLKLDPARITLLPRGVDLRRYRPHLEVSGLRERLGIGTAAPVILSPRYQVDEKLYNLEIVLAAFVTVRARFPEAVCIQMYEKTRSAAADALARRAAEYGLGESYRLVPAVDNTSMPLFYNLADVAVSVPSSDGFPVTVLEASACECPLVVSDLPYTREWFTPGENGIVVPEGDAEALARALIDLCADEALRKRIGAAGRARVAAQANYDDCMDRLEALYLGLLDGAPPDVAEAI